MASDEVLVQLERLADLLDGFISAPRKVEDETQIRVDDQR